MKKLDLPISEIIELYSSGLGCYKIAEKYKCSSSSINNLLKKNGVYTKKNPNDYRKFKFNENYFEKIDSENKAYFLGLIYSDGCISRTTLRISLQDNDGYILDKLLKDVGSNSKLYNIKKRKNTHQNQKLIVLSSKKMIHDLEKLGVSPKKSLVLEFPNKKQVPEEHFNHFIRGVFDGDGSVFSYERTINGKKYIESGVSIISSNDFIFQLYNHLNYGRIYHTNHNKNSFISFKEKNEIEKILDYLYRDSTIFLKRKYEKSQKILLYLKNKKYYYSNEPIKQYTKDNKLVREWNNLNEIKVNTNYNTQTILRNIRGKIKTSNNHIWKT